MERKTHTLLEKFVRNSITSQEGKELKDSVAKMSDEELTQTLSDVWEIMEHRLPCRMVLVIL